MYQLVCGGDPQALGIAEADGSWHLDVFAQHLQTCSICQQVAAGLQAELAKALEAQAGPEQPSDPA